MAPNKRRTISPESEDRSTDKASSDETREAGVESLPDGETAAAEEAEKARDD
jgi:hypothetical protein